jgi:hypothetical protein
MRASDSYAAHIDLGATNSFVALACGPAHTERAFSIRIALGGS